MNRIRLGKKSIKLWGTVTTEGQVHKGISNQNDGFLEKWIKFLYNRIGFEVSLHSLQATKFSRQEISSVWTAHSVLKCHLCAHSKREKTPIYPIYESQRATLLVTAFTNCSIWGVFNHQVFEFISWKSLDNQNSKISRKKTISNEFYCRILKIQ